MYDYSIASMKHYTLVFDVIFLLPVPQPGTAITIVSQFKNLSTCHVIRTLVQNHDSHIYSAAS